MGLKRAQSKSYDNGNDTRVLFIGKNVSVKREWTGLDEREI